MDPRDPMDYTLNRSSATESVYYGLVPGDSAPWITSAGLRVASGSAATTGTSHLQATQQYPSPSTQLPSYTFGDLSQVPQDMALPPLSSHLHNIPQQNDAPNFLPALAPLGGQHNMQSVNLMHGYRLWDQEQPRASDGLQLRGMGGSLFAPSSPYYQMPDACPANDAINFRRGIGVRNPMVANEALSTSAGGSTLPGLSWTTAAHGVDTISPVMLPSLRSQAYFASSQTSAEAAGVSAQQVNVAQQHSSPGFGLPRDSPITQADRRVGLDHSLPNSTPHDVPMSPPPPNLVTVAPDTVSRPHRTLRRPQAGLSRPSALAIGAASPSRSNGSPSSSSPMPLTSPGRVAAPRRQRPTRTGPRRHILPPRTQTGARNPIDRSLVREFLASENRDLPPRSTSHTNALENIMLRQLQGLHGTMEFEKVARKTMVQSLKVAPIKDLGPDEKSCTICYSDFGIKSPEGITEDPIRLPECNHVFGSQCLRIWFEESYRCPYCRKKVASEPVWFTPAAKRLLSLLKRRDGQGPGFDSADTEMYMTITRGYERGGWLQHGDSPPPNPQAPLGHWVDRDVLAGRSHAWDMEAEERLGDAGWAPRTPPPDRARPVSVGGPHGGPGIQIPNTLSQSSRDRRNPNSRDEDAWDQVATPPPSAPRNSQLTSNGEATWQAPGQRLSARGPLTPHWPPTTP